MSEAARATAGRVRAAARIAAVPAPRPASFAAEVRDSAGAIDVAAWDALRGRHDPFMDVRWLRAVETSLARDASFRHVLFRDAAGRPVASACLSTYAADGAVLAGHGVAGRVARGLRRISPWLVTYPIAFCGLPVSAGQGHLRVAPGVDPTPILAALDVILESFARERRARCIVLKEFGDDELPLVASAPGLGYVRADSLPVHQVALPPGDFESYVAGLPRKRRADARAAARKLAAGGLRTLTTSDPDLIDRLVTPETHRLYEAVVARSETRLEVLPAAFFRAVVRAVPDSSEMCFLLDGDRVVGFCLSMFDGAAYRPLFLGLDYAHNRAHDLYFNILYAAIGNALHRGSRLVVLGQTADHCKATKFGSGQVARHLFVRGVGFAMRHVVRLAAPHLFPPRPITVPFDA
ncbi:MAG: GNAT family N-acetyltransferase [Planctomycetaceae bacterium]